MSAYDDYRERVALAEQDLAAAEGVNTASAVHVAMLQRAQVHATLALAAATIVNAELGRFVEVIPGELVEGPFDADG